MPKKTPICFPVNFSVNNTLMRVSPLSEIKKKPVKASDCLPLEKKCFFFFSFRDGCPAEIGYNLNDVVVVINE